MKATIPYVKKKFEEFNKLCFAGKLPQIPIELSDAKTFLGLCVHKRRIGENGETEYFDFKLRINSRLDLPENEIEDVIIHEMIHYFIDYNQLEDATTHGPIFTHMMNEINSKYGRNITISNKCSEEQEEELFDKKVHYHVVAVVVFHDGRTGIKVLPRVLHSILKYYNNIQKDKKVLAVQLYMSNNTFFNRFSNSSALRVDSLEPEEIKQNIAGAERLECDGVNIFRNR